MIHNKYTEVQDWGFRVWGRQMAASAQSLRYGGPVSGGPSGGSSDALNRILADLCTRGNPKVWPSSNDFYSSFFVFGK